MRRLRRWLKRLVIGVAALAVAAVATISAIDFNDHRDAIAAEVERLTGREVSIAGDLGLAFGPMPMLTVVGVAFGNLPGGSRPEMARIGRLEAEVSPWALLAGEIEVGRLLLRDAELLLERDEAGRGNWRFGAATAAADGGGAIPDISNLLIEDSLALWRGADGEHRLQISRLEAHAEGDRLRVELAGALDGRALTLEGGVGGLDALASAAPYPLDLRLSLAEVGALSARLTLARDGARPRLSGSLQAEPLNLEPLLPKAGSGDDGRVFSAAPLPLAWLEAIDLELDVRATELRAAGLVLDGVAASAGLREGVLRLRPAQGKLAGGALTLDLTLDGAAKPPRLHLALALEDADLKRLARGAADSELLSGALDLRLDGSAAGGSLRDLMAGLDGDASAVVTEGYIANAYVDLLAADLLTGLLPGSESRPGAEVDCFVAQFPIADGIAGARVLLLDTARMTVTGGGTVDLRRERLDLLLKPKPKEASLLSLATPVRLGGTLARPVAVPDAAGLATGAAGAVAGNILLPGVGLLLPLLSAGSDDDHPCLRAIGEKAAPKARPARAPAKAKGEESGGIGGFLNRLGDSIDRSLGVEK